MLIVTQLITFRYIILIWKTYGFNLNMTKPINS